MKKQEGKTNGFDCKNSLPYCYFILFYRVLDGLQNSYLLFIFIQVRCTKFVIEISSAFCNFCQHISSHFSSTFLRLTTICREKSAYKVWWVICCCWWRGINHTSHQIYIHDVHTFHLHLENPTSHQDLDFFLTYSKMFRLTLIFKDDGVRVWLIDWLIQLIKSCSLDSSVSRKYWNSSREKQILLKNILKLMSCLFYCFRRRDQVSHHHQRVV